MVASRRVATLSLFVSLLLPFFFSAWSCPIPFFCSPLFVFDRFFLLCIVVVWLLTPFERASPSWIEILI
eukprot:m.215138 g.215138  ORF g.215138 m.215138 type:complete len:69 (+) comp15589_c1_seq1:2020-2226(+)